MNVILYKANIERNHFLEAIDDYLATCTSLDFELSGLANRNIKERALNATLKLPHKDNIEVGFNYLKVVDDDPLYYFINNIKWLNDGTILLELDLDTINTYQSYLLEKSNFKRVTMKRLHKDRFDSNGYRIFDTCDEGFSPDVYYTNSSAVGVDKSYIVYKQDASTTFGNVERPETTIRKLWYSETPKTLEMTQYKLTVYVTHYTTTTMSMIINNVEYSLSGKSRILFLSDSEITLRMNRGGFEQYSLYANALLLWFDVIQGTLYFEFFHYDNGYFTYLERKSYNVKVSEAFDYNSLEIYSNREWYFYNDNNSIANIPTFTAGAFYWLSYMVGVSSQTVTASSVTPQASSINIINKSNSELKQIIEIPFIPDASNLCYLGGINNEISLIDNREVVSKANQELKIQEWQKMTITPTVQERQKQYETKLYGSYCRNYYLSYDNNTLILQPERWLHDEIGITSRVTSYVPINMSNNIAFNISSFRNQSQYDNWLLASRNNNITIYTNDYLNYIRTGYNYDVKAKNLQSIKNWSSFGLDVVGAAANVGLAATGNPFAATKAVGSVTGLVGGFINNILSEQKNQLALNKKKQEAMNATVNISGSDDLALFHLYNSSSGLRLNVTVPHDNVESAEFDLFYYFGYADNKIYDELPTIKTRQYFNYIKCDIGFMKPSNMSPHILNDIQEKFSRGITYEWKYNNTWLSQGSLYENWETIFTLGKTIGGDSNE